MAKGRSLKKKKKKKRKEERGSLGLQKEKNMRMGKYYRLSYF